MEACLPVLISLTATLGLTALGIGLVVIAPHPSRAGDEGSASPFTSGCRNGRRASRS